MKGELWKAICNRVIKKAISKENVKRPYKQTNFKNADLQVRNWAWSMQHGSFELNQALDEALDGCLTWFQSFEFQALKWAKIFNSKEWSRAQRRMQMNNSSDWLLIESYENIPNFDQCSLNRDSAARVFQTGNVIPLRKFQKFWISNFELGYCITFGLQWR